MNGGRRAGRLAYLREQHGAALLASFRADTRNAPFLASIAGLTDEAAADAVFAHYRGADPTGTGACTQWMICQALAGLLPAEDLHKARETLEAFQTYKRRLASEHRDLGLYETLGDVWNAVAPLLLENAPVSGKEEERRERDVVRADSTIVLEEAGWTIAIPRTERAAKWWGRGTRWCTAGDGFNLFDSYSQRGPLIVFIRPDGAKFQFHADSEQFMDAADRKAVIPETLGDVLPVLHKRAPGLALTLDAVSKSTGSLTAFLIKGALSPLWLHGKRREAARNAWHAALHDFGLPFFYMPPQFLTQDILLKAMERDGDRLRFMSPRARSREVCLRAIQSNAGALEHVPDAFKDRDLFFEMVRHDGRSITRVPSEMVDKTMCIEAVRQDEWALQRLPDAFRRDRAVLLEAVRSYGEALEFVPMDLRDREICLEAVRNDPEVLVDVPRHLRDREICMISVVGCPRMITLVPDDVLDRALCQLAVEQVPTLLTSLPSRLRDRDLVLLAVAKDGRLLGVVPENERDDEICAAAVRNTSSAWECVPDALKDAVRDNLVNDPREREFADGPEPEEETVCGPGQP